MLHFFTILSWSCSDEVSYNRYNSEKEKELIEPNKFVRLSFTSTDDLLSAMQSSHIQTELTKKSAGFISLLDKMPQNSRLKIFYDEEQSNDEEQSDEEIPNDDSEYSETYYEALGYEDLLPNPEFAQLFNPDGELEVAGEIIKVTPNGTYKYAIDKEEIFNQLFSNDPQIRGNLVQENLYQVAEGIVLYDTYKDDTMNLEIIEEGDTTEYPDSYFDDNENEESESVSLKSASNPDYDSFPTYSNTRKTFFGRLIQNIFQTSVTPIIKFSSKRRIKGKFYAYNWLVYSETGVSGWTEKKNWLGWSKTASDELRVGWRGVVLETKIKDHYDESLKGMSGIQQNTAVNLKMPGFSGELKTITLFNPYADGDEILKQAGKGVKPLLLLLKKYLTHPTELEKADAILVSTRTHLYTIILNEEKIKYNTKSYTHVFANQAKFAVSLDLANIPRFNNWSDAGKWAKAVKETTNMNYPTLKSGEVYICGRFGDVWKGMKIVKKN